MAKKFLTGQAVILAAGESSRFWPLNHKHKSLFPIMGKALMCYKIEGLKKAGISEIIIVQKSKKDIENELKCYQLPKNLKIKYVLQANPLGTGHALKVAEKFLKDRFLVLNGDDCYEPDDIKKCLAKFPSILVKEMVSQKTFGFIVPKGDFVNDIKEKPKEFSSNLVNIGCYFLPKSIFNDELKRSSRGEYEIIDYVRNLAKITKLRFLKAKSWLPTSYPWDLLEINEYFLKNIKTSIRGKIEKNCHIKNPVIVGAGTIVKSGAYIEGPVYIGKDCRVGPNCYIRPFTSIGDNCVVGQAVELKNSIIGDRSNLSHLSYVADSIIGENCNLGAGTVLANLRFDGKNIQSAVKGKLIDTQRKKFGAVLGKGVKIGVNTSIMPGVLIGESAIVGPNSLVKENIKDNETFFKNQK